MNRTALAVFVAAMGTAACTSCSNGNNSGDGGSSGGACKNVVICTAIPLAQVNSATGKMLTSSSPTNTGMGNNSGDTCDYNGTGTAGGFVSLVRFCYDPASLAGTQLDSDKKEYLDPMGTRTDVTGVGDKAFYQSEPTGSGLPTTKVRFEASKGPVLVTFRASNVAPADDAKMKAALTDFANTLLKN